MVAFNSRILPGFWVTKLHSTNPDAFWANTGGDLGIFINNLPVFFNRSVSLITAKKTSANTIQPLKTTVQA